MKFDEKFLNLFLTSDLEVLLERFCDFVFVLLRNCWKACVHSPCVFLLLHAGEKYKQTEFPTEKKEMSEN